MTKNILFIISDTGGGHRSAANAIIAGLLEAGADISCQVVDLLRASNLPGIRNAPELYGFFSAGHIWLHNFLFRLFDSMRVMNLVSQLLYRLARSRVHDLVRSWTPDLVVVIHPLAVRPMCAYRDETAAKWPVVTVVTDLVSVHASWICTAADLYLLPTLESVEVLTRLGVPANNIRLTGFPVHPKFLSPLPDRKTARQLLGLAPENFTVLVTSGGAGGGQIDVLVDELESACPDCTLLVVAGRNQRLQERLINRVPPKSRTHVFGFAENMELLMAACDAVVTKAGPGTIMEAASLGRPLILTGAVGLQEEGNIAFVVDAGLGVYCPEPSAAARQVSLAATKKSSDRQDVPLSFSYAGTKVIVQNLLFLCHDSSRKTQ